MSIRLRPLRTFLSQRSLHTTSSLLNDTPASKASNLGFSSQNAGRVRDLGKLDIPDSGYGNISQNTSQQRNTRSPISRGGQSPSTSHATAITPPASASGSDFFEHSQIGDSRSSSAGSGGPRPSRRLLDKISDELNDLPPPPGSGPPGFSGPRGPRRDGGGPRPGGPSGGGPRSFDGPRRPFDGPRRFDGPRPGYAGPPRSGGPPGTRGPGGPGGPPRPGMRAGPGGQGRPGGPGGPGGQLKKRRNDRKNDGGRAMKSDNRLIKAIWEGAPPPPPLPVDQTPTGLFGTESLLVPTLNPGPHPENSQWAKEQGLTPEEARKTALLRAAGDISTFLPTSPQAYDPSYKTAAQKATAAYHWTYAVNHSVNKAGDAKRAQVLQAAETMRRLVG